MTNYYSIATTITHIIKYLQYGFHLVLIWTLEVSAE